MSNLNIKEIKRHATRLFKTKKQAIEYISKFSFRSNEGLDISRRKGYWIVMYYNYDKVFAEVEEIEVEENE